MAGNCTLYQYYASTRRIMYIPASCNEYWNFDVCIGGRPGHAIDAARVLPLPRVLREHYSLPPSSSPPLGSPIRYFLQFSTHVTTYLYRCYWKTKLRQHNTVNVTFIEKRGTKEKVYGPIVASRTIRIGMRIVISVT